MIQERIEFPSGSEIFKAKVTRPDSLENCKGIVIFTHGLGYCDRQYKIEGEYFADHGYMMVIYNLRGHAASPGMWTLEASVQDLVHAIDFLTQHYSFPNNHRICGIGHSTGALITLLASLRDPRIKFASIVTVVTSLADSYLHWFNSGFNQEAKALFKVKGELAPIIDKFMDDKYMLQKFLRNEIPKEELSVPHRYGLLKSDDWGEFFGEIARSPNIVDFADQIKIPLLLFRGEYDEIMDVWKTHELYEKLGGRIPSKLYVTKSRNHFHNDEWHLIQSETLKFFDEFCAYFPDKKNIGIKDILLVDDDAMVTKTLQGLLKRNGFPNVVVAHNGRLALEQIKELKVNKKKEFDLIIADIRMPELDGIETMRRARQIMSEAKGRQSPVIFITGFEGQRTQEEAKALGYVDYQYKPLDAERFLASVRKQLSC